MQCSRLAEAVSKWRHARASPKSKSKTPLIAAAAAARAMLTLLSQLHARYRDSLANIQMRHRRTQNWRRPSQVERQTRGVTG
jgi:hypothetical protein